MEDTRARRRRYEGFRDGRLLRRRNEEDGIDLNRNFPVCFDIDEKGSSDRICSEDYRVVFPDSSDY